MLISRLVCRKQYISVPLIPQALRLLFSKKQIVVYDFLLIHLQFQISNFSFSYLTILWNLMKLSCKTLHETRFEFELWHKHHIELRDLALWISWDCPDFNSLSRWPRPFLLFVDNNKISNWKWHFTRTFLTASLS